MFLGHGKEIHNAMLHLKTNNDLLDPHITAVQQISYNKKPYAFFLNRQRPTDKQPNLTKIKPCIKIRYNNFKRPAET